MFLSKEEILNIKDCEVISVKVPEWGGKEVGIKIMSGAERDKIEANFDKRRKKDSFDPIEAKAFVLAMSLCDEHGKRLFDLAELKEINKKSGKVIDFLFAESQNLNGVGVEAEEEILGNSAAAQSAETGTGSRVL